MSEFASSLLPKIRKNLRQTTNEFDDEIESYIEGCATDLKGAGILPSFFNSTNVDSQIFQAVRLYCLSNFGLYNSDMEKYAKAYASLKATLATQSKYTEEKANSIVGTWLFNDYLSFDYFDVTLKFVSNGIEFDGMDMPSLGVTTLRYFSNSQAAEYVYENGWTDRAFKTIVILSETDNSNFVEWLFANATKVNSSK